MPLYRHAVTLLDQSEATNAAAESPVFRISPLDSDPVPDSQQSWRAAVSLSLEGAGGARVRVQSSFDRENWFPVAQVLVNAENPVGGDLPLLQVLGPFIRVLTDAQAVQGQPAPNYQARVQLVSDAPFRARPA